MALIKCTECMKKFSEYANACPNCACPTKIVKQNIAINIQKKKEKLYNDAIDIILNYNNSDELGKAKEILNSLNGFKDSIDKIEEINNLLVIEKKQKTYNKALNIISNYKHIKELYEAKRLFKLLKDFKDSNEKIKYIEKMLSCNEIQKQKLYEETMEIILNYKTIDDLYNSEKNLQKLDGFKDSYKKIEEIREFLNFESECKKINIKNFVKILGIIILICLRSYILIDEKINHIKPNDSFEGRVSIYSYVPTVK